MSGWIASVTPQRLGAVCAFGVAGALLLGWVRQQQPNRLTRLAVQLVYAAAWLVVEFGFSRGDFVLGPTWRFAAGWPNRVEGWFTDPLRFGVVCEVMFAALSFWMAARLATRLRFPVRLRSSTSAESLAETASGPELESGESDHVDADRQDEADGEHLGEQPVVKA